MLSAPARPRPRATPLVAAALLVGALAAGAPAVAAAPPPNDAFAHATQVGPASVLPTTAGATSQPGEPAGHAREATVWLAWRPSLPGEAFVLAGTRPVSVHVYTGVTLGSLRPATVAAPGSQGVLAAIDALPGVTYWLQVATPNADAGRFRLTLVQPSRGRPGNGSIATATPLTAAVSAAIAGEPPLTPVAGLTVSAPHETVWYAWTAPAGALGELTVTLTDTTPGTRLALAAFSGSHAATLHELAASSSGALRFAVTPGVAYALRVSGAAAYFRLRFHAAGFTAVKGAAPVIQCRRPTGWIDSNRAVHCTARAAAGALAVAGDRDFWLLTAVAAGSSSAAATTTSHEVCDRAGRCTVAGPLSGLHVDRVSPVVHCAHSPRSGSFTSVTVQCVAFDPAGGSGLARSADRSFTLTATLPAGGSAAAARFASHAAVCDRAGNCTTVPAPLPVRIDRRLPIVHCVGLPSGWTAQPPRIKCTATAAGGLASVTDRAFTLTVAVASGVSDGHAYSNALEICDRSGACRKVGPFGPFKIDREPPSVSCASPLGWHRGDRFALSCRARDSGSGLTGGSKFVLEARIRPGGQGAVRTSSRRVCDRAGNCTPAGPFAIALDDAPPVVSCATVPQAWVARAVSVACSASDDGAGMRRGGELLILRASEPAGNASADVQFPRERVCDAVGNCTLTPKLPLVKIDRQAPVVTCARPAPGIHLGNVTVACVASDGAGSGLGDPAERNLFLTTNVALDSNNAHAATGTEVVCDRVGNCTHVGPVGPIAVDLAASAAHSGASALPAAISVLDATPRSGAAATAPGGGTVAVPYDEPGLGTRSALAAGCAPGPGEPLHPGTTVLACGVTGPGGKLLTRTIALTVTLAPDLAPRGDALAGRGWRAVGRGFKPDSTVVVTLDRGPLLTTTAASGGTVSVLFTLPASLTAGPHALAVEGTGMNGSPLLVVTRLLVRGAAGAGLFAPGVPAPVGPATQARLLVAGPQGRLAAPNGTLAFR